MSYKFLTFSTSDTANCTSSPLVLIKHSIRAVWLLEIRKLNNQNLVCVDTCVSSAHVRATFVHSQDGASARTLLMSHV